MVVAMSTFRASRLSTAARRDLRVPAHHERHRGRRRVGHRLEQHVVLAPGQPVVGGEHQQVFSRRPDSASASTTRATASSTAISDSCWPRCTCRTCRCVTGCEPLDPQRLVRDVLADGRGLEPREVPPGAHVPRRRAERGVRCVRGEVEEQPGRRRGAAHEVDRPIGEHVGGVVGRCRPVHRAVAELVVVVVAGAVRRPEHRELVPAGRAVAGRRPVREGVEVLADQAVR